MAGKRKKKPAANPARGFATTSLPSKARVEPVDSLLSVAPSSSGSKPQQNGSKSGDGASTAAAAPKADPTKDMTPEEYEKYLEEQELQLIVENFGPKSKRESQRQKVRLETDRRVLRGQADPLNTKKWLPQEVMDQVLELIQAEDRYANTSLTSDTLSTSRLPPEEDLIVKLWALQQTLSAIDFSKDRVDATIKYILDISPNIPSNSKDSIWGLEEALDWLARKCLHEELPPYETKGKFMARSQTETPVDSPLPSGTSTPARLEPPTQNILLPTNGPTTPRSATSRKNKISIACDSDIEPDDLIPTYVETMEKLLMIHRGPTKGKGPEDEMTTAKLNAKIARIEQDVLFDKFAADQKWKPRMIEIEKEMATTRRAEIAKQREEKAVAATKAAEAADSKPVETTESDDVAAEAERMAAELLVETEEMEADDDDGVAGLFDSLPVEEVDAATGESKTVINNGSNGEKIEIRDFGRQWSGVNPTQVLKEACKSREGSGVKVELSLISTTPFANRHEMVIIWSKKQPPLPDVKISHIHAGVYTDKHYFKMLSIATPDPKQSEAYIATTALFFLFGNSGKDEKVHLRLPPVWRDLWNDLMETKKEQLDRKDRDVVRHLKTLVLERQDQELEDGVVMTGAFRGRGAANKTQGEKPQDAAEDKSSPEISEYLQRLWAHKASTPRFHYMLQSRMQLPMWGFKQQVLDAVDNHQVVIICGETGCGKSTQTPSFILEHQMSQGKECKIYCTEPRRISALSLARRVSEELGEARNDLGTMRSLVGYAIRLESKTTKETRLVYATTGIVMRMLEGSNELSDITHLILDEVHERTIDSDFLLIVLKKLMVRRRDLKVVLMSATVDAARFSKYLGDAPVLNVPGRTFPVTVQYLEDAVEITKYKADKASHIKMTDLDDDVVEPESNGTQAGDLSGYSLKTRATMQVLDEYTIEYDLIVQLLVKVASEPNLVQYSKAILIFLPGIAEIRTMNDNILGHPFFRGWLVYPLHSSIATEEQEEAFLVPPQGKRKIVLATNIAETGITIPDVTCVVDTGTHREMRFDERKQMSRLIDTFISKANAKQRRGRAGRVQEGLCYHMFTKNRHDKLMKDQQTPEMLRLSLQELAIRVKTCKIGPIEETLTEALDPPSPKNIRRAIDALVDVRALTPSEELTALGYQLARLPVDVFLGKLILFGTIFKCLDMALTVASILSVKSPFSAPFGERAKADRARMAYSRADSDLLTIYNAYLGWKRVSQTQDGKVSVFCRKNYLSVQTLGNIEETKGQLLVNLVDSGFLQLDKDERVVLTRLRYGGRRRTQAFFELPARVNINSDNDLVCSGVISWSFYPKLLVRDVPGGKGLRNVGNNQNISIHPSSVNKNTRDQKWFSYYHIMQSKTFYNAHETTAVDPFAIALLCGDARIDMYTGTIIIDGNRARFSVADWKTLLVIKILRARLRDLLIRSFKSPTKMSTTRSQQHERWLEVWQKIFTPQMTLVQDQKITR